MTDWDDLISSRYDNLYWKTRRFFKYRANPFAAWRWHKRAWRRYLHGWDGTEHWNLDAHLLEVIERGAEDLLHSPYRHIDDDVLAEMACLANDLRANMDDADYDLEERTDRLFVLLYENFWSLWD